MSRSGSARALRPDRRRGGCLALSLLSGLALGCSETVVLGEGLVIGDRAPDGGLEPDASIGAPEPFRLTEPVAIEGLAGSDGYDDDPALNHALTWIYFNSTRSGGLGREDIWFSRRASPSMPWNAPEPATALNSDSRETGLALSGDGLTVYWSSDRPGGAGGLDIYVSTRVALDQPWSEPQLVEALSSGGDDLMSAVVDDGRIALFSRRDGDNSYDLWWARRQDREDAWETPEPIDELNSDGGESDPFLTGNGTQLLFTQGGDLQLAERADDGPFGEPQALETLNSDSGDSDAWADADLSYIVFASDRSGESRLYEARREPDAVSR
jgi:hypothetical protein